ncbi:M56 family peptidase [Citricoccus sp. SGAir0253]|uniref:M56 family metallopeptidase n=1 Tax=Citricoccus sp. SGAir0253 TaxID=2567881 RepID=UPI0010CCE815|nr:M56 family metallopeptidase [Citricoccus sp. SGAir0253]QCU77870.1 M56 family peptidase [Citricoccus sp. SGAir0253]
MSVLLLAALAVALAWPVPVLLGRARWVRRAPAAAMVLWQAVALAGGLALVGTPLAWGLAPLGGHLGQSLAAFATGLADGSWVDRLVLDPLLPARIAAVTGSLLLTGHLVLTLAVTAWRTVAHRRRHRQMVELLASPPGTRPGADAPGTRVLPHDVPLAYCLPGLTGSLTVLSQGLLDQLSAREVGAVVAHERAHLRQRHDLLRLAFEAWHRAVAWLPTTATARQAVAGLTEMLADDAALRTHDRADLVRAIVLTGEGEGAARTPAEPAVPARPAARDPREAAGGRPLPNVQGDGSVPLTLRLYRLLDPVPPLPLAARAAVVVLALALAALPVVLLALT